MISEVKDLQAENEDLKKQLEQNSTGAQSLMAQLEAMRHQHNETLNTSIIIRTNYILLQKQNEELKQEIEDLKSKVKPK